MEINNEEIFNLIKDQKFDKIYKMIKDKKISDLNIRDPNYNYFIQYIINFNQIDILELILELSKTKNLKIRLDVLDSDGRTILYNCIKFNYIKIMKKLIEFNKTNIGISIIDIKDRIGFVPLHYTIIFNNFEAFKLLLDDNADPYILSNDGSNSFILCLMYKRNNMLDYLLEKKYDINFLNSSGENLLQIATNYQNQIMINKLLNTNINLNNTSSDYGLALIHQTIILDNYELFLKLLDKNIDLNIQDFYGNSPLHYIFIDKRINFLELLFNKKNLKLNLSNINGDTPLHILLNGGINIYLINETIINQLIMETDLNMQNNQGITCLMKLIDNNLHMKFRDILVIKPLNFFIEDGEQNKITITDELIELMIDSYYNQIKLDKEHLLIEWEKWCSIDALDKLKSIIKDPKTQNYNSEQICKYKIREIITKEKRSLPKRLDLNLVLDSGIYTNMCLYTGSPIDILFGLVLLNTEFSSKGLGLVIDYPLSININLENHYKKMGVDYPYKLDFSNIEIIWSYQKIFFPTYFDDEILKNIKEYKYITIPIGIETSSGSHANILFWDIKNKTIERFEPNGSNYPIGFNYNPNLLDSLLEQKFKQIEPNIKYLRPKDFLPAIGFQILENLETPKCKRIGDPNGFCGVWCIWWVYQRMLNINTLLNVNNIAYELIKYIKFDNQSFKLNIRNFSKKITQIRDGALKKYNLDINDWIVGNYTENDLDLIEKDVFKLIKL
jgi:ankyrin repeat protein